MFYFFYFAPSLKVLGCFEFSLKHDLDFRFRSPPQIGKLTLFGCKLNFLSRKSTNHFDSMASKNTFVTNEACGGKRCAAYQIFIQTFVLPTSDPHEAAANLWCIEEKLLSKLSTYYISGNCFPINIAKENLYDAEWCWLLSMFSHHHTVPYLELDLSIQSTVYFS